MSFFHSDVNITSVFQSDAFENFMDHLDSTKTDAIAFLTVYPYDGFDVVSDAAITDFSTRVAAHLKKGRRFLIRYGSEMNGKQRSIHAFVGNWFAYGKQPTKFIESWKRVVSAVRSAQ